MERATRSEVLAAATRITQAVRAYLKVMEAAEIEERLERLEDLPSGISRGASTSTAGQDEHRKAS